MPFTLDTRIARPAPRITAIHRQAAETAKRRTRNSAGRITPLKVVRS